MMKQEKILSYALSRGKLTLAKACNAPVNLGKTPVTILLEQLQQTGYSIQKKEK